MSICQQNKIVAFALFGIFPLFGFVGSPSLQGLVCNWTIYKNRGTRPVSFKDTQGTIASGPVCCFQMYSLTLSRIWLRMLGTQTT